MNRENHFIYIAIYAKYTNNIIPTIPMLLISYLLEHPNKIDLYLNPKIKIESILNFIANRYLIDSDINILNEIIDYVEDLHE